MQRVTSIVIFNISILLLWVGCKPKAPTDPQVNAWYKNIRIYNLDVKTFKDIDNDGIGDFKGLTSKLGYLQSLQINAIWLAPFQPTIGQDDGYDITDYYHIDKRLGSENDFKLFIAEAKKRHIRVIMDLVLNHTSNRHPWFTAAENDTSLRHNWYVWSAKRPDDWDKGMGFPGVEKETWTFDKTARQYYFHRFYTFQPDLNFQNPAVEKEAERVMGYWLDKGMDGFRLDAVPFIIDNPRKSSDKPAYDFNILHQLSAFVKKHKPGAVLLGEANVDPEENEKYFDKNQNGLNLMFNFYANQYLFYGLASGNAKSLKEALLITKPKPGAAQWAWFLRNHDEIDLGRLNKKQLKEVYEEFGPDTNMQLYKRGIRRRLAPMLGSNILRLKLAYSLLYSLPGTPVIRYGEEIGMGDDLSLKERLAVRTPMQWDTTINGGFSKSKDTFRPVISTVEYGYAKINVATEQKMPGSLLNFVEKMIRLRKLCPEINNGEWEIMDTGKDEVLTIIYNDKGRRIMVCHNFSDKPQEFSIKMDNSKKQNFNILIGRSAAPILKKDKVSIKLDGYGFQWYRL